MEASKSESAKSCRASFLESAFLKALYPVRVIQIPDMPYIISKLLLIELLIPVCMDHDDLVIFLSRNTDSSAYSIPYYHITLSHNRRKHKNSPNGSNHCKYSCLMNTALSSGGSFGIRQHPVLPGAFSPCCIAPGNSHSRGPLAAPCDSRRSACLFPPLAAAGSDPTGRARLEA